MATLISDSELEILKIFWENNRQMMFSEIVDELHKKEFTWKNNTILTFLSRLTDKNMLKVQKKGRKNEYMAVLTEQEYLKQETTDFVGKVYEGEVKGLIATLVENDLISSDEMQELKEYWEKNAK
ncbi:BlaI/MecI/CopY family transcriptional regulator [Enterococcus sp. BWR-S5]|uniref:BlaI/MecI/CopY family transcriptional regulator n=1 Tax=Enterococcus sp. BWR-S5 TaxID=2787714 RepID=UPI001920B243|nr:BlaI/MecI/CopY family transcriptional regulator [Enterococcus sp. BWR-S5]MBL1223746.1 BlaI/MecI/CopY family transcriptional regulator [Enterococcus sp. BWR-S5]